MAGYVDIHSHWIPGVDDGAETTEDGLRILAALGEIGFDFVCATPHMRTGMFDNTRDELLAAYERAAALVRQTPELPEVALACEHHLDDTVFERLLNGEGLPYPAGRSVLIELPYDRFPVKLGERLFELRCRRLRPVLAHPERYRPVWQDIEVLDPLLDGGTVLVLDLGALADAYGRATRRCAEALVEAGYYYAASSDAHSVAEVKAAADGIGRLVELAGQEEAEFMLVEGPRSILEGRIED